MHQSQIYTPIIFGDAAPSVPSLKVKGHILVHILVCALTATFLDGFLSYFVYRGKIYMPIVFGNAAPSVSSFIGSKAIFWWKCVALQATFLDGFAS